MFSSNITPRVWLIMLLLLVYLPLFHSQSPSQSKLQSNSANYYNVSSSPVLPRPPSDWKTVVGELKSNASAATGATQCQAASNASPATTGATPLHASSTTVGASGSGQQQQQHQLMNNLRGMNSPSLALGGSGTLLSPAKANNNFISNGAITNMNPVQKPPRLNEYSAGGGYDNIHNNNGLVKYGSPATSLLANLNNPDLINDTKGNDNFAKLLMHHQQSKSSLHQESVLTDKTDSGEYSRAQGCDSLYPSGLWDATVATTTTTMGSSGMDFNQELYSLNHYQNLQHSSSSNHHQQQSSLSSINYTDKTPILGHGSSLSNCALGGSGGGGGGSLGTMLINREGGSGGVGSAEFISRTLPRSQLHTSKANQYTTTTESASSMAIHASNPGTTTSAGGASVAAGTSSCSGGGYPSDYGLPIVAGAEHEVQKSFREPLQQPPGMPTNAKTLRVWQRGGVPVLPPVTALKRALTSSRNSPDEGYQEGCGTDV